MAFIDKLLEPGEQIQVRASAYWLPLLVPLVTFSILSAASLGPVYWVATGHAKNPLPPLAIACFTAFPLVCVPMFFVHFALLTTKLAITHQRFIATRFVPIPSSIQVPLAEIAGVGVQINSSGKTFGYGTVMVLFTDHTARKFRFIRKPENFAAAFADIAKLSKDPEPSPPAA